MPGDAGSGWEQGAAQGAAAGSAFGPWGTAIGAIGGGLLSFIGGEDANAQSQANAEAQMAFQERMYGERYQMQMADMKAAGLNPMLSYMQAPPGSPSGAMAPVQNALGQGVNSAMAGAQVGPAIDQMRALTDKTQADSEVSKAQARNVDVDSLLKQALIPKAAADTAQAISSAGNLDQQSRESLQRIENLVAQVRNLSFDNVLKQNQAGFYLSSGRMLQDQINSDSSNSLVRKQLSEAGLSASQAQLNRFGYSKGQVESDYYSGPYGRANYYASPLLRNINSAANVVKPFGGQ